MKQKTAIIVAGGSGKRMGSELPKQFIKIANWPILMHTIQCFHQYDESINIIVVLPTDQHDHWQKLIDLNNFTIKHSIVSGGKERFHSVKNALNVVANDSLIAIHDGVRPLVSKNTIAACFKKAAESGTAIPVIPATESIRHVDKNKNKAVDRSHYFMVQTPQVFNSRILLKAYEQNFSSEFTDDASVVERMGHRIYLVDGNPENIKITRPMDLVFAEALLNSNSQPD